MHSASHIHTHTKLKRCISSISILVVVYHDKLPEIRSTQKELGMRSAKFPHKTALVVSRCVEMQPSQNLAKTNGLMVTGS